MTRRFTGRMNGKRYLGNAYALEVHDLYEERPTCQIDQIIRADNDQPFTLLAIAHKQGYQNCSWCIDATQQ